jgi:hypothetical protein
VRTNRDWGRSQDIAFALFALRLDVVTRSTLRALLPAGTNRRIPRPDLPSRSDDPRRIGSVKRNNISTQFSRILQQFEENGWITRSETHVRVVHRSALGDWVRKADAPVDRILNLSETLVEIKNRLGFDEEQRRRELLAVKRLMEIAPGVGQGSVRLLLRSSVL